MRKLIFPSLEKIHPLGFKNRLSSLKWNCKCRGEKFQAYLMYLPKDVIDFEMHKLKRRSIYLQYMLCFLLAFNRLKSNMMLQFCVITTRKINRYFFMGIFTEKDFMSTVFRQEVKRNLGFSICASIKENFRTYKNAYKS